MAARVVRESLDPLPAWFFWLLPVLVVCNPPAAVFLFAVNPASPWTVGLLVLVIGLAIVFGVPIVARIFRNFRRWIARPGRLPQSLRVFGFFAGLLLLFKLPVEMAARHRWLKYYYYGSFFLFLIETVVGFPALLLTYFAIT